MFIFRQQNQTQDTGIYYPGKPGVQEWTTLFVWKWNPSNCRKSQLYSTYGSWLPAKWVRRMVVPTSQCLQCFCKWISRLFVASACRKMLVLQHKFKGWIPISEEIVSIGPSPNNKIQKTTWTMTIVDKTEINSTAWIRILLIDSAFDDNRSFGLGFLRLFEKMNPDSIWALNHLCLAVGSLVVLAWHAFHAFDNETCGAASAFDFDAGEGSLAKKVSCSKGFPAEWVSRTWLRWLRALWAIWQFQIGLCLTRSQAWELWCSILGFVKFELGWEKCFYDYLHNLHGSCMYLSNLLLAVSKKS